MAPQTFRKQFEKHLTHFQSQSHVITMTTSRPLFSRTDESHRAPGHQDPQPDHRATGHRARPEGHRAPGHQDPQPDQRATGHRTTKTRSPTRGPPGTGPLTTTEPGCNHQWTHL
ncbi:unnamed protein product [Pleuronectes platessa]|uniref:Uncharacterized protein n=1 Tax=Pleuronectes platessa TaxID=8262 RepID=A0A9N7VH58_PLEPL|nr:unnamed protein product [Pleuronectes platessa]